MRSRDKTTRERRYATRLTWTGNLGEGTASYAGYARDYTVVVPGKPSLPGSADPMFRGDPERHNPEDLLVAGGGRRSRYAPAPYAARRAGCARSSRPGSAAARATHPPIPIPGAGSSCTRTT
jgi:hypothetical protein